MTILHHLTGLEPERNIVASKFAVHNDAGGKGKLREVRGRWGKGRAPEPAGREQPFSMHCSEISQA